MIYVVLQTQCLLLASDTSQIALVPDPQSAVAVQAVNKNMIVYICDVKGIVCNKTYV